MKEKGKFLFLDILYLSLLATGPIFAIILKVLFTPQSSDINISGALVFFTVKLPLSDLPVSETQVNSLVVIWSIFWLCRYITHGISVRGGLKRQIVAEWVVEKTENLIKGNMGEYFSAFAPFIAAIMGLSAFSSLLTLIGLYPPTSDINTTGGWAILVFFLITYYKFKCGPVHYIKSFGDPVPFLAPLNIISEFATPVSMAFRHYGNVLSGSVISVLVATALQGLSNMILGNLPGFLGRIPFLQIGAPAVLSVYFDIFSGLLQAFIFAMLTMLYVAGGFPAEDYAAKKAKREAKRAAKNKG